MVEQRINYTCPASIFHSSKQVNRERRPLKISEVGGGGWRNLSPTPQGLLRTGGPAARNITALHIQYSMVATCSPRIHLPLYETHNRLRAIPNSQPGLLDTRARVRRRLDGRRETERIRRRTGLRKQGRRTDPPSQPRPTSWVFHHHNLLLFYIFCLLPPHPGCLLSSSIHSSVLSLIGLVESSITCTDIP